MEPKRLENLIIMCDAEKVQSTTKVGTKLLVTESIRDYIQNLCRLEFNLRKSRIEEAVIVDNSTKLNYTEKLFYLDKIIKCCTIYFYSRNFQSILNIDKPRSVVGKDSYTKKSTN